MSLTLFFAYLFKVDKLYEGNIKVGIEILFQNVIFIRAKVVKLIVGE